MFAFQLISNVAMYGGKTHAKRPEKKGVHRALDDIEESIQRQSKKI